MDRLITGGTSAEVRARAMSLDRRIVGFEHDMAADGDTIELTLTGGYRLSLSSAKPIHAEMRGGGPQQLPKRRRWWRGGPR